MFPPHETTALFQRGPVLLIVDGSDPGHRGLPEGAAASLVLVPLAGEQDRDRLIVGADPLTVMYADGIFDANAELVGSAFLGLIGRDAQGNVAVALVPDRLGRLGADPKTAIGALLVALRQIPPHPVWTFPSSMAEVQAMAGRCQPSKPGALQTAQAGGRAVWVGLRKDAPGLRILMAPHDLDRHDLLLLPETRDLDVGEAGVGWLQDTPSGPAQAMFVPWSAVWGLRSADNEVGWLWPADVPASIREMVAGEDDVWQAWRQLEGAPMPPAPKLKPALILAPPQGWPPAEALTWALRHGAAVVLVDSHVEGVQLPPGLAQQPVVALPHRLGVTTAVVATLEGVIAKMPDTDGTIATVRAPWNAVLGVQCVDGYLAASWSWPEHATSALRAQLHYDAAGTGSLSLQQPVGPRTASGQPMLQVELQVPSREVN